MRLAALFIALCCMDASAEAAVTIDDHVLQKGLFLKTTKCDAGEPDAYNECKCDGDIHAPVLQGMDDEKAEASLNASFEKDARKLMCEGKETAPIKGNEYPASSSYHYEITFQSAGMLALEFSSFQFSGGAHGDLTVKSKIIDLAQGKELSISDIFSAKNIASINQYLYDTLSAKEEGEVLHDQIESHNMKFIDAKECHGCALVLKKDGLHAVFQPYEVASYAAGTPDIPIPVNYISNKALKDALAEPN